MNIEKGSEGELLATAFLEKKGFRVLFKNWRFSHYEIDIIAWKNDTVHFVEVKTRYTLKYGYPEDAVNKRKFRNVQRAASAFLAQYPRVKKIQFDIVSISILRGKPIEYFYSEDIYFY